MRPRIRPRRLTAQLGDVAALFALLGLGVMGFGPVFGGSGYLLAGLGGVVLGLGVAWTGAQLRWGTLTVALATVVAYFVCGGVLALRSSTLLGFVPSLETLRQLALGVVFSWKQLLTVEAPVAGFDTLLIVPLLASLITAVVAGSVALRSPRPGFALMPVVLLFVISISFGTREAVLPVVRGVALAAGGIAWCAWRLADARAATLRATAGDDAAAGSTSAGNRRLLVGAALVAVALVAGVVTGDVGAPAAARQVLRDTVVPPLDLRAYPSPLVSFRKYVRDFKDKPLLTVAGLPDGARLRLATLDLYDGVVYNVSGDGSAGSGTFARVGTEIAETRSGRPARLTFTMEGLTGVWVPDAGYLTSLAFHGDRTKELGDSLHYNRTTGAAMSTLPLQTGDSYTANVIVPDIPGDEQLADRSGATLSMPESHGIPDLVATAAAAAVGDAETPLAQVRAIEKTLHETGFLSHGLEGETASRAGHGAERISTLLGSPQMVGDDEQYAVAMALQVSQLGLPARVVMGFYQADAKAGTVQITGSDLHAWVEVAFDGLGWVSFDPTPPEDQIPQAEQPQPKSEPQAQVLQPPLPPQAPVEVPPTVLPDEALDENGAGIWATVWFIAGITGGVLLLLLVVFGPLIFVGALKARRRRRRFAAVRPSDRLSGGWSEVVDTATDLGVPFTPGLTRTEGSIALDGHYPGSGVTLLANRVDAGVFGPTEATDAQLAEFWHDVDRLVGSMSASVGPWSRLRARLSVRSFWNSWTQGAIVLTQKWRHTS
ncbi:transglutaminase-like domain-containing protein [Cryobacterium roopkundense]|uniref:Transglutaminase-like domain-containing protein n=1 Tax=Cryobacterium roopkundense TaxID=1001240 RepID=A0A7W8ZYD3_9MICO|nr:transglutaminase-like domain-containing protein [Cryobacterium roopkundense]MBB5642498.1 hypothetical protein [Cryobacterium roopkundense]